jgi:hypothetical protein
MSTSEYTLVGGQQTDGTWVHTGKLIVSRKLDNGTVASVTLPDTSGPTGPAGPPGATGATGPAGPGVATGGTTGQVLTKNTATNFDTGWTTPSARANQLTNGGFEIWQRTGPFTTSGVCADRWTIGVSGTDTFSVGSDTTNVDVGSNKAAAVTYTHGTGTSSSIYQQAKPGLNGDMAQLRGRTMSLSARVRTTVANAVRLDVLGDIVGGTASSAYHTGGGTWQTLSVTFTYNVNANDSYLAFGFYLSCTAYLDNAMLVVGSQAADYVPLHPADDLARCLRYYEIIGEGVGSIGIQGYNTAGAGDASIVRFLAKKAINPTVTKNGSWQAINCNQPGPYAADTSLVTLYTNVTAAGGYFYANNAAGMNITVEATP